MDNENTTQTVIENPKVSQMFDRTPSSEDANEAVSTEQQTSQTETPSVNEAQKAPSTNYSADDVAKIVAAVSGRGQQEKEPEQKQLTEAETDQYLNRFRVTQDFHKKIFASETPEESAAALQQLVDSTAKHAFTIAYRVMQDELSKRDQQMRPYQSFADQIRTERMEKDYFEKFPHHKGLDTLMNAVLSNLQKENVRFKSEAEALKAVGDRVEAELKKLPGFQASSKTGQVNQQAQSTEKPSMSKLSSGNGQGGAGVKGNSAPDKAQKMNQMFRR
jgi:hypothetical protein